MLMGEKPLFSVILLEITVAEWGCEERKQRMLGFLTMQHKQQNSDTDQEACG